MDTQLPYDRLLGPEGPLEGRLRGLERRTSQVQMAEEVDRALTEGGRLLVEAGTGTGKTFAYLAPALLRARAPDFRIVVSTWTRNLQEQIVDRDLPLLRSALDLGTGIALVQGRENYVCRRRADQALVREEVLALDARRMTQMRRIVDWAGHSRRGLQSELPFRPASDVWSAVRAERGNCLKRNSPYFRQCAWQWSRRNTRDAAILVVNHALLLADLKLRRENSAVLPPYHALILDEAHHLEEVAVEHLGVQIRQRAVFGMLGALQRDVEGLSWVGTLRPLVERARDLATLLFADCQRLLGEARLVALRGQEGLPDDLPRALRMLAVMLREPPTSAGADAMESEWPARAHQLERLADELDQVLLAARETEVYWLEATGGRDPCLRSAPINPAPVLQEGLFDPLHATVFTSATLATPGESEDAFHYLRSSTGIGDAVALVLPSPFDFVRQARVGVDPLPDPSDAAEYLEALMERIPFHVRRTEGQAFVLFTSRQTMEAVVEGVALELERAGIRVLVQGREASRTELLEDFRRTQPAALFGLASFWEGVDVPGEELSHVILTRLPFPVPGHPRDEALGEQLRRRGENPFLGLSLPQAVLRFKQGFGRLIRSRDDRGEVTVLDSRLLRRAYGRRFLEALPECPRVVWQGDEDVPLDVEA